MPRWGEKTPTSLELYARSLPEEEEEVIPMYFPMYTVTAELLLEMTKMEPHEHLKARSELVVFEEHMGRATFVSHQWLAAGHPDPEFRQMRVLQGALKRLLTGRGSVPVDYVSEATVPTARPIPMKEFQMRPLFLWYDYFAVPQFENCSVHAVDHGDNQQGRAIMSIPAYVGKCCFFLALCPVLDCPLEGKLLSVRTWTQRGWCRLERAARELSPQHSWILVQTDSSMEVLRSASLAVGSGIVGDGDFTVAQDREKLAPVMKNILLQKLKHCLRAGDVPGFRRHFNLRSVHLRGLDVEMDDILVPQGDGRILPEFFHQNGFRKNEVDPAGWWPLHYAALRGDAKLLQALLERRASVNCRTSKDEPMLGIPSKVSALDIACFYKHHEASQFLLSAKAQLEGGQAPALCRAAQADDALGIRLLCASGGRPLAKDSFGINVVQSATAIGATKALEELVAQSHPNTFQLSGALFMGSTLRGGSAAMVQWLVSLRADIDFQWKVQRDLSRLGRLVVQVKNIQHRVGQTSILSAFTYHQHGSTPLMQAIQSGQYETAAAIIAAGANMGIRNCRGWSAADFAREQSIPRFLQMGLQGDRLACQRAIELALPDGYVEVEF